MEDELRKDAAFAQEMVNILMRELKTAKSQLQATRESVSGLIQNAKYDPYVFLDFHSVMQKTELEEERFKAWEEIARLGDQVEKEKSARLEAEAKSAEADQAMSEAVCFDTISPSSSSSSESIQE